MSAGAETPGAQRPVHVAVCTGGRAEYGILRWVIADLERDARFRLSLLVTGSHLSEAHGGTVHEIEADGVPIARRIPLELGGVDDPVALLRSVGDASEGVARALQALECDALLVLGDRYEILGAAQGAFFAGVPIAHVAGGDVTEGAFDESIRHALTKLASLHFPTNEESAARLRRMGEDPARVHVTGTPALDHLRRTPRMTRAELEASLDVELGERNLLVTMHPVTLAQDRGAQQLEALCAALETEPESTRIVWTGVNQDPGNEAFRAAIDEWVAARPGRVRFVQSLGQARYFSLMEHVDAVVGNSSSGIYEAPSFGAWTVDVGDRQGGRLAARSVLRCAPERSAIEAALAATRTPPDFEVVSPYGDGHASERILDALHAHLGTPEARAALRTKRFHDDGS